VFTARYELWLLFRLVFVFKWPCLGSGGLSPAGLKQRRTGFDPGRSMVRVALGQVSVPVFQFSFVRITPPALHSNLYVHIALTGRVNGRSLETFQKTMVVRKSENIG
jgi:hypothetical protein